MSAKHPLVGYAFCIINDAVIVVTGDIIQAHGEEAYLVRFNTDAPYTRILQHGAPLYNEMNLFEDKTRLGDFIEAFHKQKELVADDGVVVDVDGTVGETPAGEFA